MLLPYRGLDLQALDKPHYSGVVRDLEAASMGMLDDLAVDPVNLGYSPSLNVLKH